MNRRIHAITLLCAMALASASLATAHAQTRSIRVHSFDLDLASQAGQAEMQRRIHHAVEQVCGPSGGVTMDDRMAYLSCNQNAQAGALSQLTRMVEAARMGKLAMGQSHDVIVR